MRLKDILDAKVVIVETWDNVQTSQLAFMYNGQKFSCNYSLHKYSSDVQSKHQAHKASVETYYVDFVISNPKQDTDAAGIVDAAVAQMGKDVMKEDEYSKMHIKEISKLSIDEDTFDITARVVYYMVHVYD